MPPRYSRPAPAEVTLASLGDPGNAFDASALADSLATRRPRGAAWQSRPILTWPEWLIKHAPTLLASVGAVALGGLFAYKMYNRDPTLGRGGRGSRKGKKGRKIKVTPDARPRTHGLLPDTPRTPIGLRNVGNSCFLNALLQALQSSEPFLQYIVRLQSIASQLNSLPPALLEEALARASSTSKQPDMLLAASASMRGPLEFLTSLLHLLAPANGGNGGALNPLQFYNLVVSEASGKFRGFDQQDAHELLHVLLDLLERKGTQIHAARQAVQELAQGRQGFDALLDQPNELGELVAPIPVATAKVHPVTESKEDSEASIAETDREESTSSTPTMSHNTSSCSLKSAAADSPPATASSPTAASCANGLGSPPVPVAARPSGSILDAPAFQFPLDPFKGLVSHFLICTSCQSASSSIRHSDFNSLTLNFADVSRSIETPTVEDMLRAFVKTEQVDDVRCENCNWNARRVLAQELRAEATALVTKGPKSARKKTALLQLIQQAEKAIHDRLILLQPTSGAFLQRQRQDQIDAELRAMQAGGSVEASPSPLPPPASPKDEFLNGSSATQDPLLHPASAAASASTAGADFFRSLGDQLASSEEFVSALPDSSVAKLAALCSVDTRRSFGKGSALARLPPSVCLHLNRLVGGGMSKMGQHVAFPLSLSLYRYTSEWAHSEQGTHIGLSGSGLNASKRSAARVARSAFHGVDQEREDACRYELDAVVVHQGGGGGGHYVAYRRHVQHVQPEEQERASSPPPPADDALQFVDVPADAANSEAATEQPDAGAAAAAALSTASSSPSLGVSSSLAPPPPPPPAPIVTWWFMSDALFHQVDVSQVLGAQAYLLIYSRAPATATAQQQ